MFYTIGFLLSALGLVWATLAFGLQFVSGDWWMVFPLVGILILDVVGFKLVRYIAKEKEAIDQFFLMLSNVSFLLSQPEVRRSKRIDETLEILLMPKEDFKNMVIRGEIKV